LSPATRAARGRDGEALAALVMQLRGYRVLHRRLRTPAAEVDLVCRRGRTLVLVEVKRRAAGSWVEAGASLAPGQRARLGRAADWLLARSPWARAVRIDLVTIDGLRVRLLRDV
jgi:putative endonuclease